MQLSDGEWKIMNAIWERSPASARDVHEKVERETQWAYTTVKTMLGRLVEKGALTARMRANSSLYEPRISRSQARRAALRALLDRAFDGAFAPLMSHLVEDERLSPRERRELAALLERETRRPDSDGSLR